LPGTQSANLIGKAAPYNLEFVIGDLDENESMIFVRQLLFWQLIFLSKENYD